MCTKVLGDWGEKVAARHLEQRGWRILDRNYRMGHKEIDLVARRGEVVAFVEVKTRTGGAFGHPLEGIPERKQRAVARVAESWINDYGDPLGIYRFDAVAVLFGSAGSTQVQHVEDAWRM